MARRSYKQTRCRHARGAAMTCACARCAARARRYVVRAMLTLGAPLVAENAPGVLPFLALAPDALIVPANTLEAPCELQARCS